MNNSIEKLGLIHKDFMCPFCGNGYMRITELSTRKTFLQFHDVEREYFIECWCGFSIPVISFMNKDYEDVKDEVIQEGMTEFLHITSSFASLGHPFFGAEISV